MPKRTDIKRILIIGSGPIVISQACEFDYSGTQACKALREEGFEVVLVNSNPATIMTDPEMSDRTYIEPITPGILEKIIDRERPDALLPTLGGQTGLNVSVALHESGVLQKYGVQMIGAKYEAIKKGEDRNLFKESMRKIGLDLPKSGLAYSLTEALEVAKGIGFPLIIRPSFTLGGTGGGVAYNIEEFEEMAARGLEWSMIGEILIEESVLGWKEFELEVMRDLHDNVVIICSIENFDPMGIHTGDSITVAPAQTLTDKEYQRMRDGAIRAIREIGVETGGSNIQFAIRPEDGRMVIIEMNPRVSRSSALASKATGFPIAKMAAKLAVGYTLDEIPNDITKKTPACFEPTIDYCVVKIPRFTFEKFPGADPTLTVSMKSVGETMAIGRTFKEALQKGLRSLEIGRHGLGADGRDKFPFPAESSGEGAWANLLQEVKKKLSTPNAERIFYIRHALLLGMKVEEIHDLTKIDPWFLTNIQEITDLEKEIQSFGTKVGDLELWKKTLTPDQVQLPDPLLRKAKEFGFSDYQLGHLLGFDEAILRDRRKEKGVLPTYKLVDTCGAEFEAYTPYYYSTYEAEDESKVSSKKKIMILGGGPNRIGQGIEFDYCCVHASFALKELDYETIMVNSNPETVSTDYDTSDKLYFEPLTFEDVLHIVDAEKPDGVIVQFGGQTPLNLAVPLERAGVKIVGTSPDNIDLAEDRKRFKALLKKLRLIQPWNGTANSVEEARRVAEEIGYPVVVRPSYVLGGRAMEIVYDEEALEGFARRAVEASPEHPILIDKFLEDAIEIDVDAVADGETCVIAGIMEHIEQAGIHSGDSACVTPPYSLSDDLIEGLKRNTYALAKELQVVGLMNIQYAIKNDTIYVLEVNPRASRTVPFISKATGVPWAKVAAKVMVGIKLDELGIRGEVEIRHIAVKESVFPFNRFYGVDTVLGPEMKSTGEVMGIDTDFGMAFAKSQIGAGVNIPLTGKVFISVMNKDKRSIVFLAKKLVDLGFEIVATKGTAKVLTNNGIPVQTVFKVGEGRPDIVDQMKNGEIHLVINTPSGKKPKTDEVAIRSQSVAHNIPCVTTLSGAEAVVNGIESLRRGMSVKSVQEYHQNISPSSPSLQKPLTVHPTIA
ncbi:MAG TPA: carbamoyl-phosphate synthase large subunit [Thermodesulfobacteriota bacterium]|jgi:carbamoyl-phosphate synthase large subunit|nr:carbamoyl-phosphate synthase large subunit [Thermodesulfobacteriota bacterium]